MIDDITKRKEMEEKLKESYEETKKALKREKKFIESTAHYFRNPILIASGYLEIELERELSEEDRKNIEGIKRAVERLSRTVENVVTRGEIHD